jgi:hypothetical protein
MEWDPEFTGIFEQGLRGRMGRRRRRGRTLYVAERWMLLVVLGLSFLCRIDIESH